MSRNGKSGRRWAYLTLFLMLALSIAGNIAHTVHIDPTPSALSIIRAVIWPVGLFLAIEMFMRVPWEQKPAHRLVRWIGILLPAGLAALVSYRHLRGLMLSDGEGALEASVGPIVIDGLMLMATLGLLLTRPQTEQEEAPAIQHLTVAQPTEIPADVPMFTLADMLPQPQPHRELSAWETVEVRQIPTPTHTVQPYGPHPLIEQKPKPRTPRNTKWDRELAVELIKNSGLNDHEIAAKVTEMSGSVSYKTIQRLRKSLAESATTETVSA